MIVNSVRCMTFQVQICFSVVTTPKRRQIWKSSINPSYFDFYHVNHTILFSLRYTDSTNWVLTLVRMTMYCFSVLTHNYIVTVRKYRTRSCLWHSHGLKLLNFAWFGHKKHTKKKHPNTLQHSDGLSWTGLRLFLDHVCGCEVWLLSIYYSIYVHVCPHYESEYIICISTFSPSRESMCRVSII